jgi:hypothetical protein
MHYFRFLPANSARAKHRQSGSLSDNAVTLSLQVFAGGIVIAGAGVGATIERHGRSLVQNGKSRPAGRTLVDRGGIQEKAFGRIKRGFFCLVSDHHGDAGRDPV